MDAIFQDCREITHLDLSNFNTHKITDMECMFFNCYKLKEIKGLNKFDTSNVITMKIMFTD